MKKLSLLFCLVWSHFFYAQNYDVLMIDGEPCDMHGSSKPGRKEYDQNVFKNRYVFPQAGDFDSSITLESFLDGKATENAFSQSTAVEVTGYVYDVKVGGVETCNCKTSNSLFRDTHIELTMNDQETGKENRFIVEVTPRVRQIFEKQGIDWTTQGLRESIKGKTVTFQGWLFYDFSHTTEDFANDPDDNVGRANWRATCWEIHPVTSIEIHDYPEEDEQESEIAPVQVIFRDSPKPPSSSNTPNTTPMQPLTPSDTLTIILIGAILGMVGQGLRVMVGMKKVGDEAAKLGTTQKDLFQTKQMVFSLFIAFAIGAVAGVLAAVSKTDGVFDKSTITAFIAAGYAGTDFIEGFIRKNSITPATDKKENAAEPIIAKRTNVSSN